MDRLGVTRDVGNTHMGHVRLNFMLIMIFMMKNISSKGLNSSCEIPSVFRENNVLLTCFFSEDLSMKAGKLKVIRHNTNEEVVLLCHFSIGKPPNCQARDNYRLVSNITSTLQLIKINNFDLQSVNFSCQVIQPASYSSKSCSLIFKEASTTTHYTSSSASVTAVSKCNNMETTLQCKADNYVYAIMGAVVLLVVIVILFMLVKIIIFIKKKYKNNSSDENEERKSLSQPANNKATDTESHS